MIPVKISPDSFNKIEVDEFLVWCRETGIGDMEWNYHYDSKFNQSEIFYFKHSEHAVIFRLKYGA